MSKASATVRGFAARQIPFDPPLICAEVPPHSCYIDSEN